MRRASLSYYAISSCVTAALLAGCGGSRRPTCSANKPEKVLAAKARIVVAMIRRFLGSLALAALLGLAACAGQKTLIGYTFS